MSNSNDTEFEKNLKTGKYKKIIGPINIYQKQSTAIRNSFVYPAGNLALWLDYIDIESHVEFLKKSPC